MNLEEYKSWLEKHANKEEEKAYEIAKTIIKAHESDWNETKADLYPRKVVKSDKERIKFDLLIKLEYIGKRTTTVYIGVEFKEYDIRKVLHQAIVRRPFVNYQYIATRFTMPEYSDLFLMAYYGLGWVVWDDDFVKILIPARMNYPVHDLYRLIKEVVKDAVRDKVREELETLTKFIYE